MSEFGTLIGIAAIILACGFGLHLEQQDKIAMEKVKNVCVCKE